MKRNILLKAIIITIPVLVAVYASYSENRKQKEIVESYRSEMISSHSIEISSIDLTK